MTMMLEQIPDLLHRPVLSKNPFPDYITGRNALAYARFSEWAEASRSKIEADLKRLRNRALECPAEDWELAALGHACQEWRVIEVFRRLHEQSWCPALLFQLCTKTDLAVLCDADADSSNDGYGERQKRTLAKRGISSRFRWAEARWMVATLGLVQVPASTGDDTCRPYPTPPPEVDEVDEETRPASSESPRAQAALAAMGDGSAAEVGVLDDGVDQGSEDLPAPRLDQVWIALPSYTKVQLEAVYQRMRCGLWTQFADRFYASSKKPEMLAYVQRVVRFHANLEAVQHLTPAQLDRLFDWMRPRLGDRFQCDDDLRIAARLYADLVSLADHGSLSPAAWNRYRDAEIRRIGAFCYHLFYEHQI